MKNDQAFDSAPQGHPPTTGGNAPSPTTANRRLDPITRPNGKVYQPKKVIAYPVGLDGLEGVVVFGTHDIDRAKALADEIVRRDCWPDSEAIKPSRVWWSERMRYGDRMFEDDPEYGRAGVYFADVGDVPKAEAGAS